MRKQEVPLTAKSCKSPMTTCLVTRTMFVAFHLIPPYITQVVVVVVSAESTSIHIHPQIPQQLHNHPLYSCNPNLENGLLIIKDLSMIQSQH